jgi:hypothetical protein
MQIRNALSVRRCAGLFANDLAYNSTGLSAVIACFIACIMYPMPGNPANGKTTAIGASSNACSVNDRYVFLQDR